MKKFTVFLLLSVSLLVSFPAQAGLYMDNDFNYYEPSKNYWYVSVGEVKKNKEIDHNVIRNIAIIDLNTDEITYIFGKEFHETIVQIYFETGYRDKEGIIEFNANPRIIRNSNTKARPIKDKLCIITYDNQSKKYSLWFCNKIGKDLKRAKSYDKDTDWWIDIRNGKIYFLHQIENKIQLESVEW